jgi:phospholipid/cholesterol/gamma-HCH transport system substrate-binding protein
METRANYVIVGIFTVVAVIAAFAFVYWTAAIGDRGETVALRVRIPGSASGLGRGSAVLFNGVKVGDVQRVYIDVQNPSAAIADTTVDRLTPITQSTKADIGLAGLTGQANIELKGGDPKEPNLLEEAEDQGKIAEIVANPSAVTNLLQTAQNVFMRTDSVLNQLEGFVKDVRAPLTRTIGNAEKFSDALAANADGIDKFLESVSSLAGEIQKVSTKIDSTLDAAESLLRSVDKDKVGNIVTNVDTFTKSLAASSDQIDGIVKDVQAAAKTVKDLVQQGQGSLAKVDKVLDAVDAEKVRAAVANIADISAKLGPTIDHADALISSLDPQKVTNIVGNVDTVSKSLADASGKFGQIADGVDKAVASANEFITSTRGTVGKVDKVVDAIDAEQVRAAIANITQLSAKLGPTIDHADALIRSVDPQKVTNIVGNVDTVSKSLADSSGKFGQIADGVDKAVASANEFITKTQGTVGKVDTLLDAVDPARIKTTVTNISDASETARRAVSDIARVSAKVGDRADDINQTIVNAKELSGRLNTASVRVDGILEKIDTLLGSGQAEGLVADASATLKSFKQVADTLNSKLAGILNGLSRFSGEGLQNVDSLVNDVRRSVNRVERAVTDLERNPQRIITGGDGEVRRFDGRSRR